MNFNRKTLIDLKNDVFKRKAKNYHKSILKKYANLSKNQKKKKSMNDLNLLSTIKK